MARVVLAIGHHDHDPGAVANGTTEHAEVKAVVEAVQKELQQDSVEVFIPPTSLTLPEKIQWINQYFTADDFVIEIHLNSSADPAPTGVSTWYCDGKDPERKVSEYFANALSMRMNLKNMGAKPDTANRHGRLGIVRDTIPHSWLFEVGFISHADDLEKFRRKGVSAIKECVTDLFLGGNPLLPAEAVWPFRDVPPSHFAFEAIKKAKGKGVISGYENQIFRPNSGITRGEMLVLLERLGSL
ncbi:MAG: N-acetylmuramoyl-L-alanine amidase [Candidatus Peregrinibacteria bacterium]